MSGLGSNALNRQLQQALQEVEQVQRFQQLVHKLNGTCWDLCVDKVGTRLGGSTETCLKNCVGRFLDTSKYISNRLGDVIVKSATMESID